MAKKEGKKEREEEWSRLSQKLKELRFEDSPAKRKVILDEAIASEDDRLMADAFFYLGNSGKDYSVKLKYLEDARALFKKTNQPYYANSTWTRIQMLQQEERQRRRPLWKKILLPGRAAA
jgi:hypothetical protein